MSDDLVPAFGSTWKMYFKTLEEVPSPEDLVEILGAVKVEKHYEATLASLVTPMSTDNNEGE